MADGVINGKVHFKLTKAMDMRFHWLHDRECQCQCWRPSKLNNAIYWTKHHPETHCRNMQKEFFMPQIVLKMLQMEQQSYAACAV
jgi:hypothetical protein